MGQLIKLSSWEDCDKLAKKLKITLGADFSEVAEGDKDFIELAKAAKIKSKNGYHFIAIPGSAFKLQLGVEDDGSPRTSIPDTWEGVLGMLEGIGKSGKPYRMLTLAIAA